ncbi:hypothetical protein [Noviherbaspirillum galbum]|uniref:Uncharacterized protein n=1 Tax=Noviherbaspirillum galbum TaxID=2709383 RepID=A0A6B3SQB2_9BURK|nr:hypothetical protein [Noviherbaspirillum galbum]NEX62943.1 hypothetical protein [Noviherbaspirillum galbum]
MDARGHSVIGRRVRITHRNGGNLQVARRADGKRAAAHGTRPPFTFAHLAKRDRAVFKLPICYAQWSCGESRPEYAYRTGVRRGDRVEVSGAPDPQPPALHPPDLITPFALPPIPGLLDTACEKLGTGMAGLQALRDGIDALLAAQPAAPGRAPHLRFMRILSVALAGDAATAPAINAFVDMATRLSRMEHAGALYAFLQHLLGPLDLVECELMRTYLLLHVHHGMARNAFMAAFPEHGEAEFSSACAMLSRETVATPELERSCAGNPAWRMLLQHRLTFCAWRAWNDHLQGSQGERAGSLCGYAKDPALTAYQRGAINAVRNGFLSDARGTPLHAADLRQSKVRTWITRASLPRLRRAVLGFFRKSPFYHVDAGADIIGKTAYHGRAAEGHVIAPCALKMHQELFRFGTDAHGATPVERRRWHGHDVLELICEQVMLEHWNQPSLFALRCAPLPEQVADDLAGKAARIAQERFPAACARNTRRVALNWFMNTPLRRETLVCPSSDPARGRNILGRIETEFNRQLDEDAGTRQEAPQREAGADREPVARLRDLLDRVPSNGKDGILRAAALEHAWTTRIMEHCTLRLPWLDWALPMPLAYFRARVDWHRRRLQKACGKAYGDGTAKKQADRLADPRHELAILERAYVRVQQAMDHAGPRARGRAMREVVRACERRMQARMDFLEASCRLKTLLAQAEEKPFDRAAMDEALQAMRSGTERLARLSCGMLPDMPTFPPRENDRVSGAFLGALRQALDGMDGMMHDASAARLGARFAARSPRLVRLRRSMAFIQECLDGIDGRKMRVMLGSIERGWRTRLRRSRTRNLAAGFLHRQRRRHPGAILEAISEHGTRLGDAIAFESGNAVRVAGNTSMASLALSAGSVDFALGLNIGRTKTVSVAMQTTDARQALKISANALSSVGLTFGAGIGNIGGISAFGAGVEAGAGKLSERTVALSLERDGSLEVDGRRIDAGARGDPMLSGGHGLGRHIRELTRASAPGGPGMALRQLAMQPQLSLSVGETEVRLRNKGAGLSGVLVKTAGLGLSVAHVKQRVAYREFLGSSREQVVQVQGSLSVRGMPSLENADAGSFLGSLVGYSPFELQSDVRLLSAHVSTRGVYKPSNSAFVVGVTSIAMLRKLLSDDVRLAIAANLVRTRPQVFIGTDGDLGRARERALAAIEDYVAERCEVLAADAKGNMEAVIAFELTPDGAETWNRLAGRKEAGLLTGAEREAHARMFGVPEQGDLARMQDMLVAWSRNPTLAACLLAKKQGVDAERLGLGVVKSRARNESGNVIVC